MAEGQREKMGVKTFRDLLVWQKGMGLVTKIYQMTKGFPSEEIYLNFLRCDFFHYYIAL